MLEFTGNEQDAASSTTSRIKTRENSLQHSQKILELVLDAMPEGFLWKDNNLRYLGCNKIAAYHAGLSDPEEIIGKDDFNLAWKDMAGTYRSGDMEVINTGIPKINYEEMMTDFVGMPRLEKTSKMPLLDQNGNIIGVMGIYEDITERKKMENALQKKARNIIACLPIMSRILYKSWIRN